MYGILSATAVLQHTLRLLEKKRLVVVSPLRADHSSRMSYKKEIVWTVGSLARDQKASQRFAAYGAYGAPTTVVELRITMARTTPRTIVTMFLAQVWALVASCINQTALDFSKATGLVKTTSTFDMSPRPVD